jgi:hypothetical protein
LSVLEIEGIGMISIAVYSQFLPLITIGMGNPNNKDPLNYGLICVLQFLGLLAENFLNGFYIRILYCS